MHYMISTFFKSFSLQVQNSASLHHAPAAVPQLHSSQLLLLLFSSPFPFSLWVCII